MGEKGELGMGQVDYEGQVDCGEKLIAGEKIKIRN